MEDSRFIRAAEVAADFGVSESMGYRIIKKLNSELKEKGYITVAGRVSRKYYNERAYLYTTDSDSTNVPEALREGL